jgi:hypothetical protein
MNAADGRPHTTDPPIFGMRAILLLADGHEQHLFRSGRKTGGDNGEVEMARAGCIAFRPRQPPLRTLRLQRHSWRWLGIPDTEEFTGHERDLQARTRGVIAIAIDAKNGIDMPLEYSPQAQIRAPDQTETIKERICIVSPALKGLPTELGRRTAISWEGNTPSASHLSARPAISLRTSRSGTVGPNGDPIETVAVSSIVSQFFQQQFSVEDMST